MEEAPQQFDAPDRDDAEETPTFKVVTPDQPPAPMATEKTLDDDGGEWADNELEQAYLQALQAVDAVESEVNATPEFATPELDIELNPLEAGAADSQAESETAGESQEDRGSETDGAVHPQVTPRQIIEAALFVGGTPLTIKRIGTLLRNEFNQDFVESTIDSLNMQYSDEQRPYEITFGEGGYRLALDPDFERLRARTFGYGPKEVKLSQDALEVLALVAYRQSISARQVEQAGKSNPGSILRLLVRRQLIAIERTGKKRDDVTYHTTQRFLEVFGLKDLEELPQSDDDLSFN